MLGIYCILMIFCSFLRWLINLQSDCKYFIFHIDNITVAYNTSERFFTSTSFVYVRNSFEYNWFIKLKLIERP